MINFIELKSDPGVNDVIDIIVNKTKKNYINLAGEAINDGIIDLIYNFLCDNHVWNLSDEVIHTKKQYGYVCDNQQYHDISFMLRFYNLACNNENIRKNINTMLNQQTN